VTNETNRVGFLLFHDCDPLDVTAPAAMFKCTAVQLAEDGRTSEPQPKMFYFSPDGGPVETCQGFAIDTRPTSEIRSCALGTLIVCGSYHTDQTSDPRLTECLCQHSGSIPRIAGVCTGAFVLGRAGLLDGRRAVTHWLDCDALERDFPAAEVDRDGIFIDDGGIWTAAGATASIDMTLAMIEQDYGHDLAQKVAARMVVFLRRPGGHAQVSMALRSQDAEGAIGELLKWIAANPHADLRAETLAERACMSLRNFYRAFEEATGSSPANWVEAMRLEVAKRLLEQTGEYAEQVAVKAGFTNYERMRRTFVKRVGASPLAYRVGHPRPADHAAPFHLVHGPSAADGGAIAAA
jgi:transcriptional regulator GlxA family with amidase domain